MSKPISIGQIWILRHMVSHDGLLYVGISTFDCPEPIGMSTLRGLEKRGLCEETTTSGIFSITDSGREQYAANRERLDEAIAQKRQRDLALMEEAER